MQNPLFNKSFLIKKVAEYKTETRDNSAIFLKWHNDNQKEEALQTNFLNDIFGKVLGYEIDTGEAEFNLLTEYKTQKDGTKVDGVLGFITRDKKDIRVAIELKAKNTTNLDTVEKQAFEYRDKIDGIEWVITSNTNEIRLYSAGSGGRLKHQSWTFFELANSIQKQKEFHFFLGSGKLFVKDGVSEIAKLIEENTKEENEIKNKFYKEYKEKRIKLINEIKLLNPNIDAISKAQKLLDRMLFIRFCIDRGYITKTIINTIDNLIKLRFTFYQALKVLFETIDKGSNDESLQAHERIIAWNGGLFAEDKELNDLQIGSEVLKEIDKFFKSYNFSSQVDVHILGHIFEQSISDIEKLKEGNEFDAKQSKRKKDGVFYTPEYITQYIIQEAVGGWLNDRKTELNESELPTFDEEELKTKPTKPTKEKAQKHFDFWKNYAEKLKSIKVLDPACGSGAFLVEVFNYLEAEWQIVNEKINHFAKILGTGSLFEIHHSYKDTLKNNIYGVDINFESVQITRLSLWIQTAHNKTALVSLDENIKCGNSLIDDPAVCPKAFKWDKEFPFKFDVVVGNPPYVIVDDKNLDTFYRLNYKLASYKIDLYHLFFEKGLKLLNNNGNLGFITPSNYLTNNYLIDFRKYLINNGLKIINNYGANVFEISVDTCTTIVAKGSKLHSIVYLKKDIEYNLQIDTLLKDELVVVVPQSDVDKDVLSKIEIGCLKLKEIAKVRFGKQLRNREIYTEDVLELNNGVICDKYIPCLTGNDINRYDLAKARLMCLISRDAKMGGCWDDDIQNSQTKIITRQIGKSPIFGINSDGYHCLNTVFMITHSKLDNYYLISILNSKVISFYWLNKFFDQRDTFPKIKGTYLNELPIPQIPLTEQTPFITNAQTMLEKTKELNEIVSGFYDYLFAKLGNPTKDLSKLKKWHELDNKGFLEIINKIAKTQKISIDDEVLLGKFKEKALITNDLQAKITKTDAEIDRMVYGLYGLSKEEIGVVEG